MLDMNRINTILFYAFAGLVVYAWAIPVEPIRPPSAPGVPHEHTGVAVNPPVSLRMPLARNGAANKTRVATQASRIRSRCPRKLPGQGNEAAWREKGFRRSAVVVLYGAFTRLGLRCSVMFLCRNRFRVHSP